MGQKNLSTEKEKLEEKHRSWMIREKIFKLVEGQEKKTRSWITKEKVSQSEKGQKKKTGQGYRFEIPAKEN